LQEQGERRPARPAAADDGVRAQVDIGTTQWQHLHAVAGGARLSDRCDSVGVNPASAATVATACSSALLRELTIHSWWR
jgi:hypothetical protein